MSFRTLIVALFIALFAATLFAAAGTARAEEKQEAKQSERKSKRRPVKKPTAKAKQEEKQAEGEPHVLTEKERESAVVGAGEKFGHSQFDSELQKLSAIDAVVLLDSSGSMKRTDPNRLRDQAAKLFMRFLGESDRVAILQFDKEVFSLAPFTAVTASNLTQLDQAIQNAGTEGRFTDLQLPIEAALSTLEQSARPETTRVVILLSDGKMDPLPARGTPETLMNDVLQTNLPRYRRTGVKLYTVALSAEADRDFLGQVAAATDALYWYAPDVDTLHFRFSDLFLALKKPQVVPLDMNGFEIDPGVEEATFYVARKNAEQEVALVTPRGEEITNKSFPPEMKWFKGELFDVITVRQPTSGNWYVRGVEEVEGFATLVTDLKLQVRWPSPRIGVGESALVLARLTSRGKLLNEPEMRELNNFAYKIISSEDGTTVARGSLNDEGSDGDETANDGIYAAKITIEREGQYKALIGVVSPTFTRQQQVPFVVSKGDVQIFIDPADTFIGKPDMIQVAVGRSLLQLKGLQVQLLAQREDGEVIATRLGAAKDRENIFELSAAKLPAGKYKLNAKVSGRVIGAEEPTQAVSEILEYVSQTTAVVPTEEKEPELAPIEEPVNRDWLWGLLGVIFSLVVAIGELYYAFRHFDFRRGLPPREVPYERPEAVEKALEELRAMVSKERRAPSEQDLGVFALVRDTLGAAVAEKEEAGAPAEETAQPEA